MLRFFLYNTVKRISMGCTGLRGEDTRISDDTITEKEKIPLKKQTAGIHFLNDSKTLIYKLHLHYFQCELLGNVTDSSNLRYQSALSSLMGLT